ncbi:MAG: type II secretion system GspH family protein [Acidobacteriia bacterium]|nr:type II secretion system GspH family protein [Terriglobia bacterium]
MLGRPEGMARHAEAGVTLIELICVTAIVLILAGVALPVANTWVKRQKEMELRQALRQIREAIDRFQADVQRVPSMRQSKMNAVNQDGYPEKIEWLYEGYDIGDAARTRFKYLRRLPRDPITGKREWATRSSHDRPDAHFSDGMNIFDVRSKSEAVALDGTKYSDW